MCKKYPDSEAILDEEGHCSLCGGDCVEAHYYVDIPQESAIYKENDDDKAWLNVGIFHTRQQAIDFAKEHFGADDEGKVSLVTG